jgi:hypothetical protein
MWNLKAFEAVYSRYRLGDLSVKEFCRNENISLSRFFYWQKKLKQYDKESEQPTGFVPFVLNTSGSPARKPMNLSTSYHQTKAESVCELEYPNGVKLRLPLDTDIRELERLFLLYR